MTRQEITSISRSSQIATPTDPDLALQRRKWLWPAGTADMAELAKRGASERPDLLLVGRAGERLTGITDAVRAAGATAEAVPCDLASLADVRSAARAVKDLLAAEAVRPLRALVANAGLVSMDLRAATADGYEKTFAVNYLAHPQLIGDLRDSFTTPARIVLLGSNVGPALASLVLDNRWAHLRDGAFIVIDKEVDVPPHAHDLARERRLWEARGSFSGGI